MRPTVSVIVSVCDERDRLARAIALIEAQTFWHGSAPDQVLVVDGCSTDGSRDWLESASTERPWLRSLDNPARLVSCALNLGLAEVTGELVARMDARVDYEPGYLEALVAGLVAEPAVAGTGGTVAAIGTGAWGQAVAATLRRRIGLAGARRRAGTAAGPTPQGSTALYRTAALRDAGGWDESLEAAEDFELEARLGAGGGAVWFVPQARGVGHVPDGLGGLARQLLRHGYDTARTLARYPGTVSPDQLAPPALLAGLGLLVVARPRAGLSVGALYLGLAAGAGAAVATQDGASAWRGAVVPPLVHLSWAAGLLAGLVRAARDSRHGGTGRPAPAAPRG